MTNKFAAASPRGPAEVRDRFAHLAGHARRITPREAAIEQLAVVVG